MIANDFSFKNATTLHPITHVTREDVTKVVLKYDCIICFETFDNNDDVKQLCKNSKEHILCNDCYFDMLAHSVINNKHFHCPYCRVRIQKLDKIDISIQTKYNPPSIKKKDGKLHGKCIYYYLNKNIMESIDYVSNKKHGHHITYYVNGFEKSNFNYHNNKLNGTCYLYYDNGKMYKSMHFKNDMLHGEYKELDIRGNVLNIVNYKNNKKDGLCVVYEYNERTEYNYYKRVYENKLYYNKVETYYIDGELDTKKCGLKKGK
jgi:hypothetical protein